MSDFDISPKVISRELTRVPLIEGHGDGDQHRGDGEEDELPDDGVPRAPGQPQAAGQRL